MEGWYFAPGCDNVKKTNIGNLISRDPWKNATALQRTALLQEWGK